jgi:hypothetical protein
MGSMICTGCSKRSDTLTGRCEWCGVRLHPKWVDWAILAVGAVVNAGVCAAFIALAFWALA